MINVTKPHLPDKQLLLSYIDRMYDSGYLTNRGELVVELERKLEEYFGVDHVVLVANGTIALEVAYQALGLKGDVITTPYSFVATSSTLVKTGIKPIYSDVNLDTLNLDPSFIEENITRDVSAILAVHLYGVPCDHSELKSISHGHGIKLIYDAAHAFGTSLNGKSVLRYGDVSTISFHSTKLFHTIEGGAIVTNDEKVAIAARKIINFGIGDEGAIEILGSNGKMNEFEAAVGLCNFNELDSILAKRREIYGHYHDDLSRIVRFQSFPDEAAPNFAYVPVILDSEEILLDVVSALNKEGIFPRRYFYPTLNRLPYVSNETTCHVAEDVARRTLCLPTYTRLTESEQFRIIEIVKKIL